MRRTPRSTPGDEASTDPISERRFPRRLLLTGGLTAAALGAGEALAPSAMAATTAWQLGGNTGIASDGSDYLGTRTPAPLIIKTTAKSGATPAERLRVTAGGLVGIGLKGPVAKLDVATGGLMAVQGVTTDTDPGAAGVTGASVNGAGVAGSSTGGSGVAGTSQNYTGVRGTGVIGVVGSGQSYGVEAEATGSGGTGVYASGDAYGLYAIGDSCGAFGSGSSIGVAGDGGAYGVQGICSANSGVTYGVYGSGGQYSVFGAGGYTAGVRGNSNYVGAWGHAPTYGSYGEVTDTSGNGSYGVFGAASGGAGSYGVFSDGDAHVNGTLSKAAGSFKIDHPLDPEQRWLSHSFVESPDMMNVYNGNAVLDDHGRATVHLPDYFGVLNRDFRYQLTAVGAAAPDLHVVREVADNRFSIAGGKPGMTVSWQVTGIRQDDYARAHPIVVDTPKAAWERGTREFVPSGSSAKRMRRAPKDAVVR